MDEDPNGRGEAGGVTGEMSVAKRSSMSGLFGVISVPLPAGRGIKGGIDLNCEGITKFFDFGSKSSVRES